MGVKIWRIRTGMVYTVRDSEEGKVKTIFKYATEAAVGKKSIANEDGRG